MIVSFFTNPFQNIYFIHILFRHFVKVSSFLRLCRSTLSRNIQGKSVYLSPCQRTLPPSVRGGLGGQCEGEQISPSDSRGAPAKRIHIFWLPCDVAREATPPESLRDTGGSVRRISPLQKQKTVRCHERFLELIGGFEPPTSSLPMTCSAS